ncbi:MAG: hypothetical protein FJ297_01895 [Planctomycetes bacterium]|nr:hypothetical protein [Planctomycetota bacterium]
MRRRNTEPGGVGDNPLGAAAPFPPPPSLSRRRADWKTARRIINVVRLLPFGAYPSGAYIENPSFVRIGLYADKYRKALPAATAKPPRT